MSRGKFDTRELLYEYLETRPESTAKKIRGQFDKQELYDYEKEINKPLVDMDAIEVAGMIKAIMVGSSSPKKNFSYRTYTSLLSFFRDFFDWYIDNYEVIKNPCNDKRIKGSNAADLLGESDIIFTKEDLSDVITRISDYTSNGEYADYQEAIVRLFYEGFPESIDIVNLKEGDIDHKKKTAIVRGREIQLSDRLYELLKRINSMEEMPAYRGSYEMMSYRGSYFKFPTREKFKDIFDERNPEYWGMYISRVIGREVNSKLEKKINGRLLYLRGFYDFIVEKYGQEETDRLILSARVPEDTKKLMDAAEEYGVVEKNSTTMKEFLRQFVEK